MFTSKTKPVPGADLKKTIADIDERWFDIDWSEANADTARHLHRDLFEMVGAVKGLMMGIELASHPAEEDEG